MESNGKKTLVIVGGGYAGIELLGNIKKYGLKNSLNIVLISQTNYFFHNVASPRALVEESAIAKICIPYDNKLKEINGRFIHAKVVSFTTSYVTYMKIVDDKENQVETLNYDYMVLAIGSIQSFPWQARHYDKSKQIDSLQDVHEKIKQANRILLVGGGSVGSETAGEFATDYPNKKITLLTNSDRLVTGMDNSFSTKVYNILKRKNVEIIFNDRIDLTNVENFKTQKLKTQNGKEIEFDAFFVCTGIKPLKEIFEKSNLSNWLSSNGFVQVNKYLQVADQKHIFAMGDCCNLDEPKMALNTQFHAGVVANNLSQLLNNRSNLKEYSKFKYPLMLLTLGRDNGVLRFSCFLLEGFLPKMGKSKDLMIGRFRKQMGYPP